MPSTTKLLLAVRGTRRGEASPGRPQQKAVSRPTGTQLCRAPRRFGAAWAEFGTSRSHQQRAGAGHGARDQGHQAGQVGRRLRGPLGAPRQPSSRFCQVSPRQSQPSAETTVGCLDFGRWGISCTWEGSRAGRKKSTLYSSFSCLNKSQRSTCSPGSHPQLPSPARSLP